MPQQRQQNANKSPATNNRDILHFWQQHETDFPGQAKMARDVLAISFSGAGVQRLFFAARLICSYQRNCSSADTIKRLIILRFAYESRPSKLADETRDDIREKVKSEGSGGTG
jgi:hypothetical protein